jgi:UDP-glucose 4-epimerase
MSESKILVTGGAGFIGSHVVDRLVRSGYGVRVIDNLSTGKVVNIADHVGSSRVDFVEGDIRDLKVAGDCVDGVDAVVHLAGVVSVPFSVEYPILTREANVDGTVNLLGLAVQKGVKRFVFASSCSVYGESKYLPIDERHPTCPSSPYASSKLSAEGYCRAFDEAYGLPIVILRLFNVYGSQHGLSAYSGVVIQFADRIRRGLPLVIFGDGSQTRDFVHVWDVADLFLQVLEKDEFAGGVFNIGSGQSTSMSVLANAFVELAGKDLGVVYEKPRVGDVKHSFADVSKAKKVLGYVPKITLERGLRDLINVETTLSDEVFVDCVEEI